MNKRTYGGELEKAIAEQNTGDTTSVSQAFFTILEKEAEKRSAHPHRHFSDVKPDVTLGIISEDLGEQGLDNGFNLQETALPYTTSLSSLQEKIVQDVTTVAHALQEEGKTFLNMSNHPLATTDEASYEKFVAPKGLYPFLKWRGLTHRAGIDAKAQNSPATGVSASEAADAVSIMIGLGAALVGLFANSPISQGKVTGFKESRLTMWKEMFGSSKVTGDLRVGLFPEKRFFTMAEYFTWMFSGDSAMYFVLAEGMGKEYKSLGERVLVIEGLPSVLSFLKQKEWQARNLRDILGNTNAPTVTVTPKTAHMEAMQFAQFTGERIRFGLKENAFTPEEFVHACMNKSQEVEALFEKHAQYVYIEGRDPGANFPDAEITAAGDEIAKSVSIAPSALQAGLIQNLSEAVALLEKYDWTLLGKLRDAAIKDGLDGEVEGVRVKDLAEKVVEVASRGLQPTETWMLSYPEWVLRTGKNGADRALDFVNSHEKGGRQALIDLVKSRVIDLTSYEN